MRGKSKCAMGAALLLRRREPTKGGGFTFIRVDECRNAQQLLRSFRVCFDFGIS